MNALIPSKTIHYWDIGKSRQSQSKQQFLYLKMCITFLGLCHVVIETAKVLVLWCWFEEDDSCPDSRALVVGIEQFCGDEWRSKVTTESSALNSIWRMFTGLFPWYVRFATVNKGCRCLCRWERRGEPLGTCSTKLYFQPKVFNRHSPRCERKLRVECRHSHTVLSSTRRFVCSASSW